MEEAERLAVSTLSAVRGSTKPPGLKVVLFVKVEWAAEGGGLVSVLHGRDRQTPAEVRRRPAALPDPEGPWAPLAVCLRFRLEGSGALVTLYLLTHPLHCFRFVSPGTPPSLGAPHPTLLGHSPFRGNDSFLMRWSILCVTLARPWCPVGNQSMKVFCGCD